MNELVFAVAEALDRNDIDALHQLRDSLAEMLVDEETRDSHDALLMSAIAVLEGAR